MPTRTVNGLYLVENAADFATIERELAAIDDRLFLVYEIEWGHKVYKVMYDRGDEPPFELTRWPHELSTGLVDQVKSQRPRSGPDLTDLAAANEERAEKERQELAETMDEIADDIGGRMSGTRSAVLHRGIHLRRSRTGG